MAGGHMKYRTLSRDSKHRQALLRNMVSSLIEHEAITTTWAKAKETQRLVEKVISLGKRNTNAARNRAKQIFYRPNQLVPKLFGALRERYENRPGGYTRVLRIEPEKDDQAASAIISLVDGPRDMRLAMTAQTIARDRSLGQDHTPLTRLNIDKLTKFGGAERLEEAVHKAEKHELVERAAEIDPQVIMDKKPVAPDRGRTPDSKYPDKRSYSKMRKRALLQGHLT